MSKKENIKNWFMDLQDRICFGIEQSDGSGHFIEDNWQRKGGGGGRTRVMEEGDVIEKGGVNFSAVNGETPENILKALNLEKSGFFATGVSIVMHPSNPWVPIIHMNVRYFEMNNGTYWFGGGIDLSPHYINSHDARYFHQQLKDTCDRFDPKFYPSFKKWADDYFFIKHRNETRGIGGIFFDRLQGESEEEFEQYLNFTKAIGETFLPAYIELIDRNRSKPFTQAEKDWQLIRRGRYTEFNLIYDKGTKFGLDTGGRTESILMSLPPLANWTYDHKPRKDSPEEQTSKWLIKGKDWLSLDG